MKPLRILLRPSTVFLCLAIFAYNIVFLPFRKDLPPLFSITGSGDPAFVLFTSFLGYTFCYGIKLLLGFFWLTNESESRNGYLYMLSMLPFRRKYIVQQFLLYLELPLLFSFVADFPLCLFCRNYPLLLMEGIFTLLSLFLLYVFLHFQNGKRKHISLNNAEYFGIILGICLLLFLFAGLLSIPAKYLIEGNVVCILAGSLLLVGLLIIDSMFRKKTIEKLMWTENHRDASDE